MSLAHSRGSIDFIPSRLVLTGLRCIKSEASCRADGLRKQRATKRKQGIIYSATRMETWCEPRSQLWDAEQLPGVRYGRGQPDDVRLAVRTRSPDRQVRDLPHASYLTKSTDFRNSAAANTLQTGR